MFCSECGQPASGKFCSACGQSLTPRVAEVEIKEVDSPPIDWAALTNYETLISVAEVRDRIAQHASRAKKKMTGEEFLACCDKVLTPLTGGVPFTMIAKFTQPISEKLGLKTGKARADRLSEPPGKVLVAVLSSLAENDQRLQEVNQLPNGCTIRAALPSDLWSLKGDLVVTVRAEGTITAIDADLTIPGQLYDWGKSRRALDKLFDDVTHLAKAA